MRTITIKSCTSSEKNIVKDKWQATRITSKNVDESRIYQIIKQRIKKNIDKIRKGKNTSVRDSIGQLSGEPAKSVLLPFS